MTDRDPAATADSTRDVRGPRAPPRQLSPWALLAALLALWLLWRLADVVLLLFAGALVALALRRAMAALQRRVHWPDKLALLAVVVGVAVAIGAATWWLGGAAAEQLQVLRDTLPRALLALRDWLARFVPGAWLLELWDARTPQATDLTRLAALARGTLNASLTLLGGIVLVLALGLHLATDPATYRRGALRLLPASRRAAAGRCADAVASALSRWMLGQAASMVVVGLMTAIGLALIGLPLAVPLGVIAGLVEFVPYFGPLASALLIVAVALTSGEPTALWAALVCLVVQQSEAYLVQPLIQRWAVRLPPVLSIVAVLIFGLLFGLPGVLLAVPLMVLTMTLVEQLYVRGRLGETVR